jgi:hypothetical protein
MSIGQVYLDKAMARNSLTLVNIFDKQCGQMSKLFDSAIARKCLTLVNPRCLMIIANMSVSFDVILKQIAKDGNNHFCTILL